MSEQESDVYFYDREVWWCALGANVGFDQDGKNDNFERPVVILRKFNKHMTWVLPLTSRDKKGSPFYQVTKYDDEIYYIILSQVRTISSKRLLRKIRTLQKKNFSKCARKLKAFYKNDPPLLSE